jgi:CRP/FNR family transcriptional regulator, cyclic AMP receptor protein
MPPVQMPRAHLNLHPQPPPDPTEHPALSAALRALAQRGTLRRCARKGMVLIHEGDRGDTIYIVLAGRVRAYSSNAETGREVTYGTYGPGDYFGEMSLDGGPRSASVMTLEPALFAVVHRTTLEKYLAEAPAFAFELLAKVIRRARDATLSAHQMATEDVYGRLRLLLNSLAIPQPDGTRLVAERLTHEAMAQRLGCGREMVSRLLKDLQRGGHVSGVRTPFVVLGVLPARW